MSSDAAVPQTRDQQVSEINVQKAETVDELRKKSLIKESKSACSLTVSVVCSSCDEGEISDQDVKKRGIKNVIGDPSSTNVIFFKDISDTSAESMEDTKHNYLLPGKRRSVCSKIGICKKVKLHRGIEGVDESLDSIPEKIIQLQLKPTDGQKVRSRPATSGEQRKNIVQKKSLRPPEVKAKPDLEVEKDDSPTQKYSQSIFKVFLEPEKKMLKKKIFPAKSTTEHPVQQKRVITQGRKRELDLKVPPKDEAPQKRNVISCQKVESQQKPLKSDIERDTNDQLSKQSVTTGGGSSDNTIILNRVEVETEDVNKCKIAYKGKPTLKSSDSVKNVSSKRSVRWEDEVLGPQRSTEEESSAESDAIDVWRNKCQKNTGLLNKTYQNIRRKNVHKGEPDMSMQNDSVNVEYDELEHWTENSRITDVETDSEASQLFEEILKYPSKLRQKIADKIAERDFQRKDKYVAVKKYSSSESEIAKRREKSPAMMSDDDNDKTPKSRRTKCSSRNKVATEMNVPRVNEESFRRRGKCTGEQIFRRRTSSPAICKSCNDRRDQSNDDRVDDIRQETSCSSSNTTIRSETFWTVDRSPSSQSSNTQVRSEVRLKSSSAGQGNASRSHRSTLEESTQVLEIDTKTLLLLSDCLRESKEYLDRLTNVMSKSLLNETKALMRKINSCLLKVKRKGKSAVDRREVVSKDDIVASIVKRNPTSKRPVASSQPLTPQQTKSSSRRTVESINNSKRKIPTSSQVRKRMLESWKNLAVSESSENNNKTKRVPRCKTAPKSDASGESKGNSISPNNADNTRKKEDKKSTDNLLRKKHSLEKCQENVSSKVSIEAPHEVERDADETFDADVTNAPIKEEQTSQSEGMKCLSGRSLEETADNINQSIVELKRNESSQTSTCEIVCDKSNKSLAKSESEIVKVCRSQSRHDVESENNISGEKSTVNTDEENSCKKFVMVNNQEEPVKIADDLAKSNSAEISRNADNSSTSRDSVVPRTSETVVPVSVKPGSSCLKLRRGLASRSRVSTPAGSSRRPTPTPTRPPSRKPYFSRRSSTEEEEEYTGDSLPVERIPSQLPRPRYSPTSSRSTNETASNAGSRKPPASRMYSTLKESPFPKKESIKSAMKDLNLSPKPSLRRVTLSNPPSAKSSTRCGGNAEPRKPPQRPYTARATANDCDSEDKCSSRANRALTIIKQRMKIARERNVLSSRPTTAETLTSEGRTLSVTPTFESFPITRNKQKLSHVTSVLDNTDTGRETKKNRETNKEPDTKPSRIPCRAEEETNWPTKRHSLLNRLPNYLPPWERVDLRPPESALAERAFHEKKLFGGPRVAKRSQSSIKTNPARTLTPVSTDSLKRSRSEKTGSGMTNQGTLSAQQDVSDRERTIANFKPKQFRLPVSSK